MNDFSMMMNKTWFFLQNKTFAQPSHRKFLPLTEIEDKSQDEINWELTTATISRIRV